MKSSFKYLVKDEERHTERKKWDVNGGLLYPIQKRHPSSSIAERHNLPGHKRSLPGKRGRESFKLLNKQSILLLSGKLLDRLCESSNVSYL